MPKNSSKTAEARRISQVSDFKQRIGGIQELPSGLTVKVRNPGGLNAFLSGGTIPNSLMPIIKKALEGGKEIDPNEVFDENGDIDPEMFSAMQEMMDNVTLKCVIEPKIAPVPTAADVEVWNEQHPDDQVADPEELRNDEQLYIDEIPLDDKQFILQWVSGGTRDLETFRQRLDKGVDSVAKSQNAVRAAQRAAGLDPR